MIFVDEFCGLFQLLGLYGDKVKKNVFHLYLDDIGHAKATRVVNKSYVRTPKPSEQINVEPNVDIVKDILVDNIDGEVIYVCDEAARIAKPVRNKWDELDKSKTNGRHTCYLS